jgi:hypothetical protein
MLNELSKLSHSKQQPIWQPSGFQTLAFDALVCLRDLLKRGFVASDFNFLPDEAFGIVENKRGERTDIIQGNDLNGLVRLESFLKPAPYGWGKGSGQPF